MIHYHGLPINPQTAATAAVSGGHAFVSYVDTHPLGLAMEVCQSFACDNGAFSAWKCDAPVSDWSGYYDWVAQVRMHPGFDWAVIPDCIDGSDDENDALLREWPHGAFIGVPVWHLSSSLDRLARLAADYPRIALGSSGEFASIGNEKWWARIAEAMDVVCDPVGRPLVRLHGLRMLDPRVFTRLPLASADSTNIGRNVGIDSSWRGTYSPPTKEARAAVMRARIESHNSASMWSRQFIQESLCLL